MLGHRFAPVKSFTDRHFDHLPHVQARDFHSQRLFAQPIATASTAGPVVLIPLKLLADPVAVGLAIAALHIRDHPFEDAGYLINAATFVIPESDFLVARTIEEDLLHLLGQVLPLGRLFELVVLSDGLNGLQEIRALALAPWRERTIGDLEVLIGHDKPFIKEEFYTETVTLRAGTKRRVE